MTVKNISNNNSCAANNFPPDDFFLTPEQLSREILMSLAAHPEGKIASLEKWKYNREEAEQIFRIIDRFENTLFQFSELFPLQNLVIDSFEKEINGLPKYKTLPIHSEQANTISFKDMAARALISCKKVSAFLRFQEEFYKFKRDPDWDGRKDVLEQLPDYRSLRDQVENLKKQKIPKNGCWS